MNSRIYNGRLGLSHAIRWDIGSAAGSAWRSMITLGAALAIAAVSAGPLAAQGPSTGTITGLVSGQLGEPLATVQVRVGDSGAGVLTGANGRFRIDNVPAGRHTITVQRIGYQVASQEALVSGERPAEVNFTLIQQVLSLDEVVVTGTAGGSVRRALGNAVASVDLQSERQLSGAAGLEGLLGNKVAGVQLTAPAGTVGGGGKFRIRGSSSLALSGDPLIYINGIRMDAPEAFTSINYSVSTLQDLNPADIERVEVIKGPAAATLYGTEAANGVIQIFTRRGVNGTPSFNASAEVGANFLRNPSDVFGLAFYRDPATGEVRSVDTYKADEDPDFMPNAFGRPVFRTGPLQQYAFSVRGGTDAIRYAASTTLVDELGYTRLEANRRASTRVSLTFIPNSSWSVTLDAARANSAVQPGMPTQGYFMNFNPLTGRTTPIEAQINARSQVIEGLRSTWSGAVDHEPFGWLRQRLVVGIDRNDLTNTTLTPKSSNVLYNSTYADSRDGRKTINTDDRETLTADYSSTARLPAFRNLNSSVSFGLQWYTRRQTTGRLDGRVFATPALTTIEAAAETSSSESFGENTTLGTYVQGDTNWRDRLYLTAAVRFDKNSAFGETATAAIYPKVSASWVLSEEPFWEESRLASVLPSLRLRGAWGASGQQPEIFAAQRLYRAVTGPGGNPILTPLAAGNPDLRPERGEEIELGLDAELADGRVGVELTWYNRATRDAMVRRVMRPSEGFPGDRFENVGLVTGGGVEAGLNFDVLRRSRFQWQVQTALGTNWTKVNDMGGAGRIEVERNQFHVEGFPLASFFDIRVLSAEFENGVSGSVINALCDGGRGRSGMESGGPAVPCAEAPLVFYGQGEPTWTIGLTNTFQFGGLSLRTLLDAKGGHHFNPDYLSGQNQWSSEQVVRQDDPIWMGLRQYGARGGQVIHHADYLVLRELSLRYNIPPSLLGSIRANSASVTVTGYNLSTLWFKQGDYVDFGGKIWAPEMQAPSANYPGTSRGGQPAGSRASVRFDVSF